MLPAQKVTRPVLWDRLRFWASHPWAFVSRLEGEFYKLRHPDEPWISDRAVRFCETSLTTKMSGLEWGSGRSTAWFGRRLKRLVSVEHAAAWHQRINEKIKAAGLDHVDYRLIPLDHPVEAPTHREYAELPRYVKVIEEFPDASLDFVVVDGHYRQACIRAALPKLKPGGLLLVDNTNWMPLSEWGVPANWKQVHRSMGFEGETTLWRK